MLNRFWFLFPLCFFPAFRREFHTPWPDSPAASSVEMLFHSSGDEGVFQHAAIQPINMFVTKQWETDLGDETCSRPADNRFTLLKNKGAAMPLMCLGNRDRFLFPLLHYTRSCQLPEGFSAPATVWYVPVLPMMDCYYTWEIIQKAIIL